MNEEKLRVLMELRPALESYAGIPQETRLLFRGLCTSDNVELEGLLQPPFRKLARGTTDRWLRRASRARTFNKYSRVIVSLTDRPTGAPWDLMLDYIARRSQKAWVSLATLLGLSSISLTRFESALFEDFVWRTLFAKTLAAADFDLVTNRNHRICSVSWDSLHAAGLATLLLLRHPRYPRVNTRDFDLLLTQTPYPARVSPPTMLVVRYHDAIPIFMPHTISSRSKHQAHHFYSLMSNVREGAYFACVSDASRQALLQVFPEAAERTVTIHNMVSDQYFREESSPERIPQIIFSRLERRNELAMPNFLSLRESTSFYRRALSPNPLRFLLAVATVEPRKNHMRLLAAWELIRSELDPTLKLVVVGGLGWDYEQILRGYRSAIDQGASFFLNEVPAADLRVLYRHAVVTVCPSLGEGFDFAGVEAMRSGGIVAASDIPVHREIYEDAAEYFDPYSTSSLVTTLRKLLTTQAGPLCDHLRARGAEVSERYMPERVMPRWDEFLQRLRREREGL